MNQTAKDDLKTLEDEVLSKSGPPRSRKRICKDELKFFELVITALRRKALTGDASAAKAWHQLVKENVGVTVVKKPKASKTPLDAVMEGLPTRQALPASARESTFSRSEPIINELEIKPGVSPANNGNIDSKSVVNAIPDTQEAGGNGGNENQT